MKIAIAHCEGVDPASTGQSVVMECLRQLQGEPPHTGILFANDEIDHQLLLDEIHELLPSVILVGCCAVGEISSTAGYWEDSVCLMLIAGDGMSIGGGYGVAVSQNAEKAAQDAVKMARANLAEAEKLCLVFGDGLVGKHTSIIDYLNAELSSGCGVFGGMSGVQRYNYGHRHTSQFYQRHVLQDAVVILLFAGPLEWTYALCNSWKPIGESTIISGVDGNAVTRIGNQSALEFFRSYLGAHSQPATEHPFAVYENGHDNFYLRVPTGYDEVTGAISFPIPLPLGANIQMTESSRQRALVDIRRVMTEVPEIVPDLCFIFSCDIRKNIFGTKAAEEEQTITQYLGRNIPTIGFYTLGEVAPLYPGGGSIVHHCTLVVLLVRVKPQIGEAAEKNKEKRLPLTATDLGTGIVLSAEKEAHSLAFLKRQLKKEHYYRQSLEENKELMGNLFRNAHKDLEEKNRTLHEIQAILEHRVAERTQELQATNARLEEEIVERMRAFAEKENLEKQFNQSQKMEALGTLAGGIAHDFNNVLTPILGYTEILMENLAQDPTSLSSLQEIFQAGRRAKKLIEQILLFSRKTEQELQPLQIGLIVKETMKLLRSCIPKTISFKQKIDADVGCVLAEPTQVHQVLMNLCTNAFHAMGSGGGVLEVRLEEVKIKENDLRPVGVASGTYLHLVVSDTGCGMDDEVQKRIFEPYFTTKEAGKGTGLGLAVTHGIITKYRGWIEMDSELSRGTAAHIYLPVSEEHCAIKDDHSVLAELPKGKEHILLVDDETMIVKMYGTVLQKLGYTVTKETDGSQALARFMATPNTFQLVILDYAMPGMNGEQVARRILSDWPHVPIILTTGYSALLDEQEMARVGVRRCLTKPISMDTFAGTVRELLDDQMAMK